MSVYNRYFGDAGSEQTLVFFVLQSSRRGRESWLLQPLDSCCREAVSVSLPHVDLR